MRRLVSQYVETGEVKPTRRAAFRFATPEPTSNCRLRWMKRMKHSAVRRRMIPAWAEVDVIRVVDARSRWLGKSPMPKMRVDAEPGSPGSLPNIPCPLPAELDALQPKRVDQSG